MEKTDAEKAAETAAAEAKAAADKKAADEADSQRRADEDKRKRTEKEKAEYSLKKNAERVRQLGGDPSAILDSDGGDDADDDDKPVTHGDLRRIRMQEATQTAEQLANAIEDEGERDLVKAALINDIKPSGNPAADLAKAKAIVNAEKNRQIAEEAQRGTRPRTAASGSGGPAHQTENQSEFTADEQKFMKPPYNLSKEKILEARKKAQGAQ